MATVVLQQAASFRCYAQPISLHAWLEGHWAILLSDPDDFAPHPSTPSGFIVHECAHLRASSVKLATLDGTYHALADASDDSAVVLLDQCRRDSQLVDFAERALARKISELRTPFVLILDGHGRIRSTLTYRPRRIDRPRTVQDLLRMIEVLRAGSNRRASGAGENAPLQLTRRRRP